MTNLLRLACRRETAAPMLALVLASATSVGLAILRALATRHVDNLGLIWNLFLAWLPLVFALLAGHEYQLSAGRSWRFRSFTVAWLLFFPNAPYIFTDLVHLPSRFYGHYWIDMLLILLFALTGLVVGFLSLFLMHSMIARMAGRPAGWLFIATVAGLSGFGVWLGRFLRFNSWDVVLKPYEFCHGLGSWLLNPFVYRSSFVFSSLFALFVFLSYLMLYALTHLPQTQFVPAAVSTEAPRAGTDQSTV